MLLIWLDLHHVYRIAVVATLIAGALLAVRVAHAPRAAAAAIVALAIAGIALLRPGIRTSSPPATSASVRPWTRPGGSAALLADREHKLGSQRFPLRLMFYDDDPIATVSVIEYAIGDQQTLAIQTNGKTDGSLAGDYGTMALTGLIPCLIADRCEKAFVIGLGTGVTAGELASLDAMQRVVVAEISPAVIRTAPLFDYGTRRLSKNPKVEFVRSDAYRAPNTATRSGT